MCDVCLFVRLPQTSLFWFFCINTTRLVLNSRRNNHTASAVYKKPQRHEPKLSLEIFTKIAGVGLPAFLNLFWKGIVSVLVFFFEDTSVEPQTLSFLQARKRRCTYVLTTELEWLFWKVFFSKNFVFVWQKHEKTTEFVWYWSGINFSVRMTKNR